MKTRHITYAKESALEAINMAHEELALWLAANEKTQDINHICTSGSTNKNNMFLFTITIVFTRKPGT